MDISPPGEASAPLRHDQFTVLLTSKVWSRPAGEFWDGLRDEFGT